MTVRTGALIAGRYRVERGSARVGWAPSGWPETKISTAPWRSSARIPRPTNAGFASSPARRASRVASTIRGSWRCTTWSPTTPRPGWSWSTSRPATSPTSSARRRLPPETSHVSARQLAEALAAVHALGIVHGDVKPGNVLITEAGDAKLTDFGVARALWGDETISDSGLFRGTPAYVAPGGRPRRQAAPGRRRLLPRRDPVRRGGGRLAARLGRQPADRGLARRVRARRRAQLPGPARRRPVGDARPGPGRPARRRRGRTPARAPRRARAGGASPVRARRGSPPARRWCWPARRSSPGRPVPRRRAGRARRRPPRSPPSATRVRPTRAR